MADGDTPVDPLHVIRQRVQLGPVPAWVTGCAFDRGYKSHDAPVTCLCFDTQIEADRRETYVHQAFRLETMEAVQRYSQWRIHFEPNTQSITLHALTLRRGNEEFDHLDLEKARFLQREEGLDRFLITGWFTLLIVLPDVRPGDVLEFSYTVENQPRVFADNCHHFFGLSMPSTVGKLHFAVRFSSTRPMKWKSGRADWKPVERQENGTNVWEWTDENYDQEDPERNTPTWYIPDPWIQISDIRDWQTIAAAVSKAWHRGASSETIAEIAREIEAQESELAARVEKAVRFVQDECRYLSVSLELGGFIPMAPEIVAQRRFGDCKDLSFLLVNLLEKFGVRSRPVLVNSVLGKSIGELLPSPSVFNHVVVEFEANGKRRWIDTTLRKQGGGAFNRSVPDYGVGLPVDITTTVLVEPPKLIEQTHLYDVRECIVLDTSGEPSLVSVTVEAEGKSADLLRQQLDRAGTDEMAKQRLQAAAARFREPKRVGELRYRDDRLENRFVLVETFEFVPLMARDRDGKRCQMQLPISWVPGILPIPEKKPRQTPFALPYPCNVAYAAELILPRDSRPRLVEPSWRLKNELVEFSLDEETAKGSYQLHLSLKTKTDAVPSRQIEDYRRFIERLWKACGRSFTTVNGFPHGKPKPGFGCLPGETPTSTPSGRDTRQEVDAPPVVSPPPRTHPRPNRTRVPIVPIVIGGILVILWLVYVYAVLRDSHH